MGSAERDRLGAWVIGSVGCMVLQKLMRLLFRSMWIAALSPELFTQAFVSFWRVYAHFVFWGDALIQGIVVGGIGYVAQRRSAATSPFRPRRVLPLVLLILLIEIFYFPSFVQYYPEGISLNEFLLGALRQFENIFKWDIVVQIGVILTALRLVPETSAGLEHLFAEIRERWLE